MIGYFSPSPLGAVRSLFSFSCSQFAKIYFAHCFVFLNLECILSYITQIAELSTGLTILHTQYLQVGTHCLASGVLDLSNIHIMKNAVGRLTQVCSFGY